MLNDMTTATDAGAPVTGAYTVDTGKGGHNGDVSRQWMARPADQRFANLDDLFNFKKAAHLASSTLMLKSSAFEIHGATEIKTKADLDILRVGFAGVEPGADVQRTFDVAPNNWSFRQIAGLAKAPAAFLADSLPAPIVADVLNWQLKHNRQVDHVKVYTGKEELFAATGPNYGRIPDFEVVDALRRIAGDGLGSMRWKTPGTLNWSNGTYDPLNIGDVAQRTFYGSDRDCYIFLVDDMHPIQVGLTRDGKPDHMFRGIIVQNSEVGAKTLKLSAFYLRGVCMNRNLWGVEGFEELTIRHTSQALDRWAEQAKPALESFAARSDARLIEGVERVKAAKLADDDAAALEFLANREFTKSQAKRICDLVESEEGRKARTVWDFAQGITAMARDIPNTDDRLAVEGKAKQLLDKVAA